MSTPLISIYTNNLEESKWVLNPESDFKLVTHLLWSYFKDIL